MKVYPSEESDKDQGKRIIEPPIPLERPQKREMSKNDYITFKLRSTPADSNSTTYEFTIPYFDGSESPEETLDFIRDVRRAYKGQNVNDGSGRFALIRRLLRGDALAAFEREVDKNGGGDTTKEEYTLAVQGLIGHMFPVRALLTQRRAMRRIMRKPVGTTMKVYMARLTEINHKLANFPPFEPNQMLTEGELLDIGEFGTPPKWRKQMVLQNFDPLAGDTEDLVQFCQRMEATERSDTKRSKTALSQKIPKRKRGGARAKKWCPVCDMNNHTLEECKVVKRLKAERNQRRDDYQPSKRFRSNSWRREDQSKGDRKFPRPTKEQVNTMVAKAIKRMVKQGLTGGIRKEREEIDLTEEQELHSGFKDLQVSDPSDANSEANDSSSESSDSSDDE